MRDIPVAAPVALFSPPVAAPTPLFTVPVAVSVPLFNAPVAPPNHLLEMFESTSRRYLPAGFWAPPAAGVAGFLAGVVPVFAGVV